MYYFLVVLLQVSDRSKYERLAADDKKRYEKDMAVYRGDGESHTQK